MRADLRRTTAAPLATAVPRTLTTAMPRTLATALAAVLLGTGGALATPAPAAADTPTPSPLGIGPAVTESHQRGIFGVSAWTDTPGVTITKVSATLRKGDTVVEIPSLPAYEWDKGRFGLGQAPLKLTEDGGTMPTLGRYAIDITATDSRGNTRTRTDAGVLDFTLRPQLEFAFSAPGWDDRTTVPSGTLTGVQPGSGDIVPITGRTIDVQRTTPPASPVQSPVTDGTGAFTGEAYTDVRPGDEFRVAYTEDSDEVHGSAGWTRTLYTWRPHTVTVKATTDRVRVLPGQQATVTGRMTDPKNGGAPLAGQQLRIGPTSGSYLHPTFAKVVTTDADGRFTTRIPSLPGLHIDGWAAAPVDPYQSFGTATVGGRLAMPQEARVLLRSRALSADAKVTATGKLRATYDPEASVSAQPLLLEVSADGRTGWRQIGSAKADDYYDTVVRAGSRGGWYRLRHPATDVLAEAVSNTFRLVRTETRITGANAGPEPVRKGAYVTMTGTLQHYTNRAWRTFGSGSVALQFQAKGSTTWRQVATGRPAANGRISLRAKATVDGTWRLRYYGDATHFTSPFSWADYLDVR
ncbi:hypothetical protein [Streptomyces sp. SJL17-1]|uniref:hypothetical protein n=1 Tax=Streptomyces sp. SJL17-1 TaxID=2967223 RepID=UPI0029665B51|nr:hypothetical protein [Streptomyces sp. SJL17-1]